MNDSLDDCDPTCLLPVNDPSLNWTLNTSKRNNFKFNFFTINTIDHKNHKTQNSKKKFTLDVQSNFASI